jgi:hypothetical protein
MITEFSGTVGGWIQAVALTDLVSALVDEKHLGLDGRELAPGELRRSCGFSGGARRR